MSKIQEVFIQDNASVTLELKSLKRIGRRFENAFANYIVRYLDLLIKNKLSAWITSFLGALKDVCINFSSEFIESSLLPKLYTCLRAKISGVDTIIEIIALILAE